MLGINKKDILSHSITNENYYINDGRARKFIAATNWPNKDQIARESGQPKNVILRKLDEEENVIYELENYEYDKYYKYCVIYKHESNNIENLIDSLCNNNLINTNRFNETYLSNIVKPTIKEFDDSFDLKFSLIRNKFKYPVIVSFFKENSLIAVKYSSIGENNFGEDTNFYSNLNYKIKEWIQENFNIIITKAEVMEAYRNIFLIARKTPIIDNSQKEIDSFIISATDLRQGSTALKITDENDLPLIDSFAKLTDKFENENDKILLLSHIDSFLDEADYNKIGLFWWAKFNDTRGHKTQIKVSAENKDYPHSSGMKKYCQLHFHSNNNLNRNKINYVISKIAEYL